MPKQIKRKMTEYASRPYPKIETEPTDSELQVFKQYTLTDQDILRLYGLFTPQEICDQFNDNWCAVRGVRSIYRLIQSYGLDTPSRAKSHLKKRLMAYIPKGLTVEDWDNITDETLAMAKAEAAAEIQKNVNYHCAIWDPSFHKSHPLH